MNMFLPLFSTFPITPITIGWAIVATVGGIVLAFGFCRPICEIHFQVQRAEGEGWHKGSVLLKTI